MHSLHSYENEFCQYDIVLFRPELLTGNPTLREECVEPLLDPENFDVVLFEAGGVTADRLIRKIDRLSELEAHKSQAWEFASVGVLHTAWADLYSYCQNKALQTSGNAKDAISAKRMVSFIRSNYADKISQDDIAQAGRVCRSKCSSLFRKFFGTSPIEFLNALRLEKCRQMLFSTDDTVASIGERCGFKYPSYFSSVFTKTYGCSPAQYRKISK